MLLPFFVLFVSFVVQTAVSEEPLHTDSRSPYVHRLTLYDVDGTAISPEDVPSPQPYSPTATCGKCHPVGTIGGGWHFNAGFDEAGPGRPGEPWILSIPELGMTVPLSDRAWPGTYSPAQLGLSAWDFTLKFGHHHPGGGVSDPNQFVIDDSDEMTRWNISGTRQTDCMICHAADQQHDPAEAERQLEDENLKWIPTAALGLGVVQGSAKDVPDDYDPFMPNPDMLGGQPPTVALDASRFDVNERVFFNITRDIPPQRCYFCHTTRIAEYDPNADSFDLIPLERSGEDIHLTAGLTCVDCHRHGIAHDIVRGYRTEAAERGQPWRAALSCEGCHLGVEHTDEAAVALGGRLGAPHPQHRGLPPIHFEKLTCTACHSGPWPEMTTQRTQTALNHGLGLASRDRNAETPPKIISPVFVRQADGKIAPQRLVWPAIWGWLDGDTLIPATPEQVRTALQDVALKPDFNHRPNARNVESVLAALDELDSEHDAVYVLNGAAHSRGDAGLLRMHPLTRPYTWPLAHDVRPASQSLGSGGCVDCHSKQGAVYFGLVEPAMRLPLASGGKSMLALRGDDVLINRAWAELYPLRPWMKWGGWVCVLLAFYIWMRGGGARDARPTRARWITIGLLIVSTLLLALTGFGGYVSAGRLEGWLLMGHTAVAPLLLIALVAAAGWLLRRDDAALTLRQRALRLALILGLCTAATMLSAMLPLFGYAAQEALLLAHRYSGLAFVVVLVVYLVIPRRAESAQGVQPA